MGWAFGDARGHSELTKCRCHGSDNGVCSSGGIVDHARGSLMAPDPARFVIQALVVVQL